MPKIVASAPGKLILHGEHAVVYGKAAVALSIGLRNKIEADLEFKEKKFKVILNNLKVAVEWKLDAIQNLYKEIKTVVEDTDVIHWTSEHQQHFMNVILSTGQTDTAIQQPLLAALYLYVAIFTKFSRPLKPLIITSTSELPLGAGLGSSASFVVCLSALFLALCGKISASHPPSGEALSLINKWAFQAEKILHGQPSGIDNSICTFGGALLFKKGKISQTLNLILPINILLINTKISRNTKAIVSRVKIKYQKHKDVLDHVMCAINSISECAWKLLQESTNGSCQDITKLEELITMNHHLLNVLEVSHPCLNEIIEIAKQHNFAAKLTGAGCGGCAFVLLSMKKGTDQSGMEKRNHLFQTLTNKGYECFDAIIGCQGITFH